MWVTRLHVHARPDCSSNPHANPRPYPASEAPLKEPCPRCFPEIAKKLTGYVRRICLICNPLKLMPCKHNGGVQVETGSRPQWTWPSRALLRPVLGYGNVSPKKEMM